MSAVDLGRLDTYVGRITTAEQRALDAALELIFGLYPSRPLLTPPARLGDHPRR